MNILEIKEKLILTFSTPLREYYKRHVVFWNDPEKEFVDTIKELTLDGVTIIELTNNNHFKVKNIINDDSTGNLLIYDTTNTDLHKDWFVDARLYADETLHFDFYSMIMSRLGIVESRSMRETIKKYDKFWKNEERVEKLKKVAPKIQSVTELHLAILAVLSNSKSTSVPEILYNVFINGFELETNKIIKSVQSFGSMEILWKVINKYVGNCNENLINAFDSIIMSALYQTMGNSTPAKLRTLAFQGGIHDCHSLVTEWTHNNDYAFDMLDLISILDDKYSNNNLFESLLLDELLGSDLFPSINETILKKLFTLCSTKAITGKKLKSYVEDRRKKLWYSNYSNYFDCLYAIGELFELHEKYQSGFHFINELELWNEYQKELCLYDTHYRHIHYYVYKSSVNLVSSIQDKMQEALIYIENLYKNFYLNGLNDSWINLIKNQMNVSGCINSKIKTQLDFYKEYVEDSFEDKLTIVIISDGMRYEIAKELADVLKFQLKCDIGLDAIQSVFPAITKYGKPALLPGEKTIDDSMNVLVNGFKVNDITSRKSLLQKEISGSYAMNYADLINMNTTEKKEFLKGKKIIYVYHDDIDKTGHDSSGESKVFDACHETVYKLLNLVRALTNARSSIRVIITSDHGFLYSYHKLDEVDKLPIKSEEIVDGLGEKRCLICKNPIATDFLIPIKLLINNENKSLLGYAPYQTIRIKGNGGPSNYVHGGLSLQELMVPVIIFDNVRTSSKAYEENHAKYDHMPVKLEIVTPTRNIYGLIAAVEFLQEKPISVDAVEATYEVLFEDKMGKPVSDSKLIIANKIDVDPKNRRFKVTLNLKPGITTDTYYLLVNNQNTNETIIKEEFKIENSFGGDFDF